MFAAILAGSLVSCDTGPALTQVKFSQAFQHLLYIGLYVAKDAGFFREEGLDVSISTAGGDAQAFAALSSGQVDFAQGDPAFVAIGAEKGWNGKVVAMAVDRVAVWGVTLRSDIQPFTDPVGFKNFNVATYPEPNTSFVVQKELVQRAGLKLGLDTRITQVQFGSEIAALRHGQVDIAQTIEPNVSQLETQNGKVVFSYPDAYGPLAFTGVMTSEKLIRERPKVVQSIVTAYEKSLQFIRKEPDKSLEIAAKQLPQLEKSTIKRALDRLIGSQSLPQHAAVDLPSWEKLLRIRISVGDLRGPPKETLIENRFAEKAREVVR
jgi:NitT/TauT family transport system substrate-binding protein